MEVDFFKYHGLGNDYLVIDPNVSNIDLTVEQIKFICDRHFGAGSDGILYGPIKEKGKLKVRIFNPDGSEAEKSGNGLRIFSRYLYDKKYVDGKNFSIDTLGGVVEVEIISNEADLIKINMGKISFSSKDVGMEGAERKLINSDMEVEGLRYKATCLSIGNPHCVILTDELTEEKAREIGPIVENNPMFVNRINVQLLKVINRNEIAIRIWERGAGYTLASGSSSCAAAAAAYEMGMVDEKIKVVMPGGELFIEMAEGGWVFMTGPVEKVYEGKIVIGRDCLID